MQGDFSRSSFDRRQQFTRVLAQQGRVRVDADWNEQAAISRHAVRMLAADLMGPHAGPRRACGFDLLTDPAMVATLTDDLGRPLRAERVNELRDRLARGDFLIGQGRYYVEGMAAECDSWMTYSEQLGYPFDDDTTLEALAGAGRVLVYLDVWERHVSAAERPEIVDVALGGVDTTTRAELVWQVRILRGHEAPSCADHLALARDRLPLLRARANRAREPLDPGIVVPEGGYRGSENCLYRVEIHRGGHAEPTGNGAEPTLQATDGATFSWSRENASVVFAVQDHSVEGAKVVLRLDHLGADPRRGLVPGGWAQLVDDASTMRGIPSPILQVEAVDIEGATVVLTGAADETGSTPDLHPILRRWDHDASSPALSREGALLVREAVTSDEGWIELEAGVEVQFLASPPGEAAHTYRTGDYWLVPARTATRDVIWPQEVVDGELTARPRLPDGVPHYVAPLAVASSGPDGSWTVETDCRRRCGPP